MTDGKLDALRRDPAFRSLDDRTLLWLGRVVDLFDVPPGAVLSPADEAEPWGYYCTSGRLHVLVAGAVRQPARAPRLFLPEDLVGTALVAAAASRVVAFPGRAVETLLAAAPRLAGLPALPAATPASVVVR